MGLLSSLPKVALGHILLAGWLGALLGFSAQAQARVELLRWQQSDLTNVAGFNVYVSQTSGSYGLPIDVGMATLESADIYFYDLLVADGEAVYVVLTTYSSAGLESEVSNEKFLRACVGHVDCSDGDVCNGDELCAGGICTAGSSLVCPVSNSCQTGTCDSQLGCLTRPLADGTVCDDGDVITVGDVCQTGVCVGQVPPAPPPPPASPECAADTDCGDGNICNGAELCVQGACASGSPASDGTICSSSEVSALVCEAGACVGELSPPQPPECGPHEDCGAPTNNPCAPVFPAVLPAILYILEDDE